MKDRTRKILRNPYFIVFLGIALMGLVLYAPFIFGYKIFAYSDWGYDTWHSYLAIFEFYANRIREFRFSSYDFSYGLGTSVFSNIAYFFDPFSLLIILLGVVFGNKAIAYLLIFSFLLRNVVMGLITCKYLRCFRFSNTTIVISSVVAGFCGYIMITGQHYLFGTYAVIYMISIYMLERYIRDSKKYLGVILAIAWQGIIGPYFLFQGLIGLSVYFIIRTVYVSDTQKEFWHKTLITAGYVLIGILLSMVAFLPQAYEIMRVSNRVEGDHSIVQSMIASLTLLPKSFLKTSFLRLFAANLDNTINNWTINCSYFETTPYCFSILLPIGIVYQWYKAFNSHFSRKRFVLSILVYCIMVFAIVCAVLPCLSNMFTALKFRHAFIFIPVFLFCIADTLEDILKSKYSISQGIFVVFAFAFILGLETNTQYKYARVLWLVIVVCMVLLMTMVIVIKYTGSVGVKRIASAIVLCSLVFPIGVDSAISLYYERNIIDKSLVNNYQMPQLQRLSDYVKEQEKNNFYRLDRDYAGYDGSTDINYGMITADRTLGTYNSTLSWYIHAFCQNMLGTQVNTQISSAIGSYGDMYNSDVANLLGLKYMVSMENKSHLGWEMIREDEGYYLYENMRYKGAGRLYSSIISESEYESLPENIREKHKYDTLIINDVALDAPSNADDKQDSVDSVYVENKKMEGRVEVSVKSSKAQWLYMPIVYDANWDVYVNGKRKKAEIANYGFIAVQVESGNSNISFVYHNKQLYLGASISGAMVVLIIGITINNNKNRRKRYNERTSEDVGIPSKRG